MEPTGSVWTPSNWKLSCLRRWEYQGYGESSREDKSVGGRCRCKSGEFRILYKILLYLQLIPQLNLPLQPHRVSVRSVTANRRTSRDAACTMIIGRDVSHLGPTNVKATNITCSSAVISWLPANSNHQHVVCVNNVEVRTLKPGVYRHTITGTRKKSIWKKKSFIWHYSIVLQGLSPSTQYRVTVRAKQLRAPGQQQQPPPIAGAAPHEVEAPGAYTDFRTLAKGLPDPPQVIFVF